MGAEGTVKLLVEAASDAPGGDPLPPVVARLARWLTAVALAVTAALGGGAKAWAE